MPSPYQLLQKTPQKQNLIELLDYNEIFACGRVIIHQCLRNIPLGEKGKKKKTHNFGGEDSYESQNNNNNNSLKYSFLG